MDAKIWILLVDEHLDLWLARGQKAAAFRIEQKHRARRMALTERKVVDIVRDDIDTGEVLFRALPPEQCSQ